MSARPGTTALDAEAGQVPDLERQQAELFGLRHGRAHRETRERGPHGLVRIGGLVLIRHLHGDERREIVRLRHQQPFAVPRLLRHLPADDRTPLPTVSFIGSRFSTVTPCFFTASVLIVFSIWAKVIAGRVVIRIAALRVGVLEALEALARHHAGRRHEADARAGRVDRIGCFRRQGKAASRATISASARPRESGDPAEFRASGLDSRLRGMSGGNRVMLASCSNYHERGPPSSGRVTRRKVRLIRPPSLSKRDVPG